jgi:hypothetical protein
MIHVLWKTVLEIEKGLWMPNVLVQINVHPLHRYCRLSVQADRVRSVRIQPIEFLACPAFRERCRAWAKEVTYDRITLKSDRELGAGGYGLLYCAIEIQRRHYRRGPPGFDVLHEWIRLVYGRVKYGVTDTQL